MTKNELDDWKMPQQKAVAGLGAVMVFIDMYYASFSETISPDAARKLAAELLAAADEADKRERERVESASRESGICSELCSNV